MTIQAQLNAYQDAFNRRDLTAALIIAEGRLQAKLHRDAHAADIPLAVVLETQQNGIMRLSTYLDARPYRLWTDGTLFASVHAFS